MKDLKNSYGQGYFWFLPNQAIIELGRPVFAGSLYIGYTELLKGIGSLFP